LFVGEGVVGCWVVLCCRRERSNTRANEARVEHLGCCLFNSLLGGDFL